MGSVSLSICSCPEDEAWLRAHPQIFPRVVRLKKGEASYKPCQPAEGFKRTSKMAGQLWGSVKVVLKIWGKGFIGIMLGF